MMKTKIILSILIYPILFINSLSAQTYYYNTSKTFYENGYTYQCDMKSGGLVTLYNKNNKYTYVKQKNKDGSPYSDLDVFLGKIDLVEDDTWTKPKCYAIINNVFSTAEKQRLKNVPFMVRMTIDTGTGKVIEVDFILGRGDNDATIPVSTYRKIETELKNNIWFTLTKEGKKLNYVRISWMHEVK